MTSAADLLALQEIDLRRDARRAVIADIEARLGETDAVVEAREAVRAAGEHLEHLRSQQREVDAKLEDLDAKIRPLETKLYDGSVRNPKDLTDMQRELQILKRQRSELDDRGLELIEAIEAAAARLAAAREAFKRTESAWKAEQDGLLSEKGQAEAEYERLGAERDRRASALERAALGLYETLRQTKQGRAVARVERGTCQGCRISLPTHLQQRLRGDSALVQCPSCERILVAT